MPEEPEPDGPPPPPYVRRRRRLIALVAGLVAFALAVFGLVVLFGVTGEERDVAEEADGPLGLDDALPGPRQPSEDGDGPGEGGEGDDRDGDPPAVAPDERIDIPDPQDFDGATRVQLRLMARIDASEQAMLAFQLGVGDVFVEADPGDIDATFDAVAALATRSIDALSVLRDQMTGDAAVDTSGAATGAVRDTYVVHLDSWVDYLTAIADEPRLITGSLAEFTIRINATGDAFVRAVDELIDEGVHVEVGRVGRAIVERGFAGPDESQV